MCASGMLISDLVSTPSNPAHQVVFIASFSEPSPMWIKFPRILIVRYRVVVLDTLENVHDLSLQNLAEWSSDGVNSASTGSTITSGHR